MFQTVRHWWGTGRGKVTARLFAFEFVVVVAGILTAQALADWSADRAKRRAVDAEHKRIIYDIGHVRQAARIWLAAAPCLEQRVEQILLKAGRGEAISPQELRLPLFRGYTVERPSGDMLLAFRDRYVLTDVDDYTLLVALSQNIVNGYQSVRQEWDRFGLADPAFGPISPSDRAAVRDAAIQARSQLRRLQEQARLAEEAGARLRIAPERKLGIGVVEPIQQCGEIWRSGRIWREPA